MLAFGIGFANPIHRIWMFPLRSVPPSGATPETEIVNASAVPGSPLSVTSTVNVHGAPLLTHVPLNVAVVSEIANEVMATLWILAFVA